MCGISGIISYSKKHIIKDLLQSLYYIQHRGQDSYGITTLNSNNNLCVIKNHGLIDTDTINITEGDELYNDSNVGIGHVRYPTTGTKGTDSIQPFHKYVDFKDVFIMAHNGQIQIKEAYMTYLKDSGIDLKTNSDSELLLNIISYKFPLSTCLSTEIIRKNLNDISEMLEGSYSIILYIKGYGMIVMRDKNGIKPLIVGHNNNTYLVSSESISLKSLNYKILCDVNPGEAIIFNNNNRTNNYKIDRIQYVSNHILRPCIFEWIYIANIASIIDGVSVYDARVNMGEKLSKRIYNYFNDNHLNLKDIDYVVPVPETSKSSTIMVAEKLCIKYREIIIKNRYVNRTFIMDSQEKRKHNLKHKFMIIEHMVRGKNILLIDDSIVRGNTLKHLVKSLKEIGAASVIVGSCSPEIKYINRYGIDIQDPELLVANNRTNSEIADYLGADHVIYQTIDDLKSSITELNPDITDFELSVFNNINL
jgi:amidophosphoribosyltransferase